MLNGVEKVERSIKRNSIRVWANNKIKRRGKESERKKKEKRRKEENRRMEKNEKDVEEK